MRCHRWAAASPLPAAPWVMSWLGVGVCGARARARAWSMRARSPTALPASYSAQAVPRPPKCRPGRTESRSVRAAVQWPAVDISSGRRGSPVSSKYRVRTARTPAAPCCTVHGSVSPAMVETGHSRLSSSGVMESTRCSTMPATAVCVWSWRASVRFAAVRFAAVVWWWWRYGSSRSVRRSAVRALAGSQRSVGSSLISPRIVSRSPSGRSSVASQATSHSASRCSEGRVAGSSGSRLGTFPARTKHRVAPRL